MTGNLDLNIGKEFVEGSNCTEAIRQDIKKKKQKKLQNSEN